MLDFRVRRIGDVPANLRRDIALATFSVSIQAGQIAAATDFSFTLSEWPDIELGQQFDVTRFDGTRWSTLPSGHSRFIVSKLAFDDTDAAQVVTVQATNVLSVLLAKGVPEAASGDGFEVSGTPGAILRALIDALQGTGWASGWTPQFTATHDSNGELWQNTAVVKFQANSTLAWVVEQLTKQGFLEVSSRGTDILATNPRSESSAPSVKFEKGSTLTRKKNFSSRATIATVIDDDGVARTAAGRPSPLGRLETVSRATGTVDSTTVNLITQQLIVEGEVIKSFGISEPMHRSLAWVDWQLGDYVTFWAGGEEQTARIEAITAVKDIGDERIDIDLGLQTELRIEALARRIASIPAVAGTGRLSAAGGASTVSGARIGTVDPRYAGDRRYGGLAQVDWSADGSDLSAGLRSLDNYRPEGGEVVLVVQSEGYSPIIYGRVLNPNQPRLDVGPAPWTPLTAHDTAKYGSPGVNARSNFRFLRGALLVPENTTLTSSQFLWAFPEEQTPVRARTGGADSGTFLAVRKRVDNGSFVELVPVAFTRNVLTAIRNVAPLGYPTYIVLSGIRYGHTPAALYEGSTYKMYGGRSEGVAWVGGVARTTGNISAPTLRPAAATYKLSFLYPEPSGRVPFTDFGAVNQTANGFSMSPASTYTATMEGRFWDTEDAAHTWQPFSVLSPYTDSPVEIAQTASGMVMMRGFLNTYGPEVPAPRQLVGIIPSGMRPSREIVVPVASYGCIRVMTDGRVIDEIGGGGLRMMDLAWDA